MLIHSESTKRWTGENQAILSDFERGRTEASGQTRTVRVFFLTFYQLCSVVLWWYVKKNLYT